MGDKISGYPAKTTIHDDDLLDFSNTEDSGVSYDASQKVKVSEFMAYVNSSVNNIYGSDGNINENRTLTSNGSWTKWLGGDVIVTMDNESDDYAFIIQLVGSVERGRFGFDQLNASGELSLSNLSGEFFKANNNEMFVNTDGFFVSNNNRVGVNTSSPLANLHVTGDGSDVVKINDSASSQIMIIKENMTAILGTFAGAKDNRTTFLINGNAANSQSNAVCLHAKANIDDCTDSNIALFESSNTSGGTPSLTSNVLKVISGWAATGSITGLVVGGHGFTGIGVDNDSLTQLKVNHIYENYATPPFDTVGFEVTNNVSRVVAWGTPTRYKYGAKIISTGVWENSTVGGNDAINIGLDLSVSGGEINYAALFNGGNVGIGTTTPNEILDVNGRQFLSNQSAPSTPTGGGTIYVESGALKYIGSSGTVTTLGVA
ncbi:MAG: hypothetical protein HRT87_07615 [Legionellales bacterium]|nr:hypothetical protein [Legionellales bacterium]